MQRRRRQSPSLTKDDWIKESFRILAESGWQSLTIEGLARRLNVTKGSFYWHFKDRKALLSAVLESWRVQLILTTIEDSGGTAVDKIQYMLDIVIASKRPGRAGALELAIRVWARRDPEAARVVEAVDEERMDYVAGLFQQLGLSLAEAEARAMLLFAYIFSQGVLSFTEERYLEGELHRHCREMIAGPKILKPEKP